MRVALDTNILVYAEGFGDERRQNEAVLAIEAVEDGKLFIPAQVILELFNVLVRKMRLPIHVASDRVMFWQETSHSLATDRLIAHEAISLVRRHSFQIFDAVIIEAASAARCDILLSEDMHHGFAWRGMTIINPFAADDPQH